MGNFGAEVNLFPQLRNLEQRKLTMRSNIGTHSPSTAYTTVSNLRRGLFAFRYGDIARRRRVKAEYDQITIREVCGKLCSYLRNIHHLVCHSANYEKCDHAIGL